MCTGYAGQKRCAYRSVRSEHTVVIKDCSDPLGSTRVDINYSQVKGLAFVHGESGRYYIQD